MIECETIPATGTIRLSGSAPNGQVEITRIVPGQSPTPIRFGTFLNDTGGWSSVDDSEAPAGLDVTHRSTITLTNREIQRNRVLTPTFIYGAKTWVPGSSRVLTTGTFGNVTSNPGGTGAGTAGRTIGEVGIATLAPSTQYLVTGQVRIHTPALWTWQDVLDNGTWADLVAAKDDWADVQSSEPVLQPDDVFTTVWVSLFNPSGGAVLAGPTKAIDVPMNRNNEWFEFAVYITTPASMPAGAKLRLLHGTETREYAINWDLNQLQIKSMAELGVERLFYFDGDTPRPAEPAMNLTGEDGWVSAGTPGSITWAGTPGQSESVYLAATQVYADTVCMIEAPATAPCDPSILLSDPINPNSALWVGLLEIGDLDLPSRMSAFAVKKREFPFAHHDTRIAETGQLLVLTKSLNEYSSMRALFASGRVLLLRNPDRRYPENDWYLMCGDLSAARIDGNDSANPERTWTFDFVRVERPQGLIETSSGTDWAEIKDVFTWGQLRAARQDWLAVVTEPVS